MNEQKCDNCFFHVKDRCHRHPPKIMDDGLIGRSVWPRVADDEWCGEWRPQRD